MGLNGRSGSRIPAETVAGPIACCARYDFTSRWMAALAS